MGAYGQVVDFDRSGGSKPSLRWWGYIHVNGTLHVKRYFDQRDLDEANESDFVARVLDPVMATGREDAIKQYLPQVPCFG